MKNMVLFGSMSGRLPGRYTDGIIVNVELVVHVVVKSRQHPLDTRQIIDAFWFEAVPQP